MIGVGKLYTCLKQLLFPQTEQTNITENNQWEFKNSGTTTGTRTL